MNLAAAVLAPLLFVAACTGDSSDEQSVAVGQATSASMASAYKQARMAEICATRTVELAGGIGAAELATARARLRRLIEHANRAGLSRAIEDAERSWRHFQSVADWVCGEPSGAKEFDAALDTLSVAIDSAASDRR